VKQEPSSERRKKVITHIYPPSKYHFKDFNQQEHQYTEAPVHRSTSTPKHQYTEAPGPYPSWPSPNYFITSMLLSHSPVPLFHDPYRLHLLTLLLSRTNGYTARPHRRPHRSNHHRHRREYRSRSRSQQASRPPQGFPPDPCRPHPLQRRSGQEIHPPIHPTLP
jgi:hypothetical protein